MAKKSVTYTGAKKPFGRSGHFHQSRRHSLQARGFKTGRLSNPMPIPRNPYKPKIKQDPFAFQDSHQEKVIHSDWDEGNWYRKEVLEGAGDIFRELTRPMPTYSYIREKENRIRSYLDERFSVHPDDSFELSYKYNKDKFKKMIKFWEEQPYNTELQRTAIKLNIALLKGEFGEAEYYLNKITRKDTDRDGVPDIEDCSPLDPTKQDFEKPIQELRWYVSNFVSPPLAEFSNDYFFRTQIKRYPNQTDRDKDGVPDEIDLEIKKVR